MYTKVLWEKKTLFKSILLVELFPLPIRIPAPTPVAVLYLNSTLFKVTLLRSVCIPPPSPHEFSFIKTLSNSALESSIWRPPPFPVYPFPPPELFLIDELWIWIVY